MKYSLNKTINTYESTPQGYLSPVYILNYFQEIAQRQLEELNVGLSFNRENDLAWILVKYEIDINELPKTGEEVCVETEPTAFIGFEAYRNFWLKNKEGKDLVKACSVWMLIDINTGKLQRTNKLEVFKNMALNNERIKISNLKALKDYDLIKEFTVGYHDIDVNFHSNNMRYLYWALETIPLDMAKELNIKKIKIIFKDQSFLGDKINSFYKKEEDSIRIDIKKDKDLLAQVEIK